MKVKTILEAVDPIDFEDQIVDLGLFVRSLLKVGGKPTYQTFQKAVEYIRDNPRLDASDVAVALQALAEGKLESYYRYLKDQNPKVANHF